MSADSVDDAPCIDAPNHVGVFSLRYWGGNTDAPFHLATRDERSGTERFLAYPSGDELFRVPTRHALLHRQTSTFLGTEADARHSIDENIRAALLVLDDDNTVRPPSNDALDAHRGAKLYYDALFETFARDGIDGVGGTIRSFTEGEEIGVERNAYWDTEAQVMVYGPGMAKLDIVAHELTHGLIAYSARLSYYGETGALNEAIADMFAAWLDHEHPWEIGSSIESGALRDLAQPLRFAQPDHVTLAYEPVAYSSCSPSGLCPGNAECQQNECVDASHNSDIIHINSGIVAHAFYLLAEGGQHRLSRITVPGIGIERAIRIVYGALTRHLGRGARFADARTAFHASARELMTGGQIDLAQCSSVLRAFAAVGIGTDDHDGDCIADDADTCPCGEDCTTSCFAAAECDSLRSCPAGLECNALQKCDVPFPLPWECRQPSDCLPGSSCRGQHCARDTRCEDFASCEVCLTASGCSFCPSRGCIADSDSCADGVATTCASSRCSELSDCASCVDEPGCGYCSALSRCVELADAPFLCEPLALERAACANTCEQHEDCTTCQAAGCRYLEGHCEAGPPSQLCGPRESDAGSPDPRTGPDAGVDAGDSGVPVIPSDDARGCSVGSHPFPFFLVLLALRRRRKVRAP